MSLKKCHLSLPILWKLSSIGSEVMLHLNNSIYVIGFQLLSNKIITIYQLKTIPINYLSLCVSEIWV